MMVGNEIAGTFNRDVVLQTGTVKVYKDNVLFLTFTQADITVTGNAFSIDVTGLLTAVGVYRVEVSEKLFKSAIDENTAMSWEFTLATGEFDNTEFEVTEFLTV